MTHRVCVIPGDDSAPEAVRPALRVLRSMQLDIDFVELPSGEEGQAQYGGDFFNVCRSAVDSTETTLFGSSSGKTGILSHLRWGKGTYANVRPIRSIPGAATPLREPEGIDFVIVRENMEDLYVACEGELSELASAHLKSRRGEELPAQGRFAVKVITEANSRRIAHFAFRLARERRKSGHPGRVAMACKYNMLPLTDGFFREVVADVSREYHDVEYQDFIVDDFARRIVTDAHQLDVVLLPNLYGDVLSDEAAALVGGLGVVPSGCYSDSFAYFEPVHGTAPDIVGTRRINPTATLLSAAMLLEHLGLSNAALSLRDAVDQVYVERAALTPDQGGVATADEFCDAVAERLEGGSHDQTAAMSAGDATVGAPQRRSRRG